MGSDWPQCGMALHEFCSLPTRDHLPVVNAESRLAERDGVLERTEALTCGSFFPMMRASFTAVSYKTEFDV